MQILGLEEVFEIEFNPEIQGEKKKIRLKGVIDRLDQWGDEIRIIDYKSGKVEDVTVKIDNKKGISIEDLATEMIALRKQNKKSHALQLMIYSYLYYKSTQRFTDKSGIISFNNISKSPFLLEFTEHISRDEFLRLIELVMTETVREMYDLEEPFEHNPTSKYCRYCGGEH